MRVSGVQFLSHTLPSTPDVDVYRLVSKGTVEEVRYCRQIYKRQHADQILEGRKMDPLFKGYQREGGYQELTDRDKEAGGSLFGLKALLDGAGESGGGSKGEGRDEGEGAGGSGGGSEGESGMGGESPSESPYHNHFQSLINISTQT